MAVCQRRANAVIDIPATAQMSNSVLLGIRSFKEQPKSATAKAKRKLKSMRLVLKITFSFWVAREALTFLEENPFAAIHSFMWFIILVLGLGAVIEFLAIRWIVTKKLNLE